jgi:hypothetical protein
VTSPTVGKGDLEDEIKMKGTRTRSITRNNMNDTRSK